jgi:hypothetical protein
LIVVETLDDSRAEEYEAFVRAQPSLVYHGDAYRRLVRDLLDASEETLLAVEDGELRGVLPLLSREGPAGRVFNSLPYYGSNGGVIATTVDTSEALARAYLERATDAGTLSATIVPNPFAESPPITLVHNLTDARIAQFTPIPDGPDALLKAVEPSARRNVMKARRLGYRVERDASALPRLRELHHDNMRAMGGRPKDERFFDLVAERFRAGDEFDVWVARLDDDVAAALLVFYWDRFVEYYTPAIDHEHRSKQPLSLILFEAMLEAGRRGLETWNWGGTWLSQETLYRFKRKWGAHERPYRYLVQLNDREVLTWPPSAIIDAYPDFYVVPFSALEESPSRSS